MHPLLRVLGGAPPQPMSYIGNISGSGNITTAHAGRVALGLQVGDVVVAISNFAVPNPRTNTGSAWTLLSPLPSNSFYSMGVWYKVLNATDLANTWLWDGGAGWDIQAYRGKGVASLVQLSRAGADSPGSGPFGNSWTPDTKCRGAIVVGARYDAHAVTMNSGWSARAGGGGTSMGGAAFAFWYDKLELKPAAGTWTASWTYAFAADHHTWMILEARAP